MAQKKVNKSDLKQDSTKLTTMIDDNPIIDIIIDPKSFNEPDQINHDFISEDQFTKQEYLQQICYYSQELLIALEGIFIGGHAAQIKDQLFVVLNNYKNGNG